MTVHALAIPVRYLSSLLPLRENPAAGFGTSYVHGEVKVCIYASRINTVELTTIQGCETRGRIVIRLELVRHQRAAQDH